MSEENEVESKVLVQVDREKYVDTRSATGNKSLNNGDSVAVILSGLPIKAIHAIGSEVMGEDTAEKYGHLNVGMQRMNVGNRIRGFINAKKLPEGETSESRANYVTAIAEPFVSEAKADLEARQAEADQKAEAKAQAAAEKAEAKKAKAEAKAKAKADKAAKDEGSKAA